MTAGAAPLDALIPEPYDIRTADGCTLRADVYWPPRGLGDPLGVVVLAHAMMARRSEFDRPKGEGLAPFLARRRWRVVTFDFRGHGDSDKAGPHGPSSYDDFVRRDLPAVCEFARSRLRKRKPVVVIGHSLGGHVALAAQGTGAIAVDGVACIGAAVWLRRLEPSLRRWWIKRAVTSAIARVTERVGRFPARILGLGSDDETRATVRDVARFVRTGRWASADGSVDYFAALADLRVPVLQVVSEGDTFECAPDCGIRFATACGGPCEIVRITRGDDGAPAPSHMGIVTGGKARHAWERVETWMRELHGSE